jgi:hypothetical protein
MQWNRMAQLDAVEQDGAAGCSGTGWRSWMQWNRMVQLDAVEQDGVAGCSGTGWRSWMQWNRMAQLDAVEQDGAAGFWSKSAQFPKNLAKRASFLSFFTLIVYF